MTSKIDVLVLAFLPGHRCQGDVDHAVVQSLAGVVVCDRHVIEITSVHREGKHPVLARKVVAGSLDCCDLLACKLRPVLGVYHLKAMTL